MIFKGSYFSKLIYSNVILRGFDVYDVLMKDIRFDKRLLDLSLELIMYFLGGVWIDLFFVLVNCLWISFEKD